MLHNPVDGLFDVLGEQGFDDLVRAFYAQVPADDLLGPMYPAHDMEGACVRLRDFLIGRCGGPSRYVEERGHPRLRKRHAPYKLDEAARDRWLALMDKAFETAGTEPEARGVLASFFSQTADFLRNA